MVIDADALIRDILGLETTVSQELMPGQQFDDYRRVDFSAVDAPRSYWQLRAHRYGFLSRVSILDLIFNLGPEAPLLLFCGEKTNFVL